MPTVARRSRIEISLDAKIEAMRSNRNVPAKTRRAVVGLMFICGVLSFLMLPLDIVDSTFVNWYTKIVAIFGVYNLIQEIRETLRTNKLGLPKTEHYSKYINGYRPRICTITHQLVWKEKDDVIDHRNNDEVAKQLIEYNLTGREELQQLGFICQKSGRVMSYPTRVLRACDIHGDIYGFISRIKIDEANSEHIYRFEGSVIAKDALLVGLNPLSPEQKIRLSLSGDCMREGQGYGYKVGDIILDTDLDASIEKFFEKKIQELNIAIARRTPSPAQTSDSIQECSRESSRRSRLLHFSYPEQTSSDSENSGNTTKLGTGEKSNPQRFLRARPQRVLFGK